MMPDLYQSKISPGLKYVASSNPQKTFRILMVTPRYFPEMGGVENHVYQVATRLAQAGVQISVLTTDRQGKLPAYEQVEGVHIQRVRAWPAQRDYYFAPGIYSYIQRHTWDLIHIQSYHTLVPPLAMLAARRAGIPYVVTFHGGGHSSHLRNALRKVQWPLLRPLISKAERLIALANFEIELWGRIFGIPSEKFVVIPNGADLPSFQRSDHSPTTDRTIIASIGRLERYKGHQRIIAALPFILNQFPDVQLWIAGVGPYEQTLRQLAHHLNVADHVEIRAVPVSERRRMAEKLSQAALVVLLSEYETHPIAVLEAIALGRPALVAATSGLNELASQGLAQAIPLESTPRQVAAAVLDQLRKPHVPPQFELPTWDDCTAGLFNTVSTNHRGVSMRILMLTQFYHPIIGGEERIVKDMSVELVKRGHEVAIATLWHEGSQEYEIDHGVQIFRIHSTTQRATWLYSDSQRRHAPPLPDPEATLALWKVLKQVKPQIVHAHNWLMFSFLPLKRQSHSGLVLSLHDYSLSCSKRRLVYQGSPCSGPGFSKCLACASEHYGTAKGILTASGHWVMSTLGKMAVDMFLPVSMAVAAGNGLVDSGLPFQVIPNFVPDVGDEKQTDTKAYTAQLPEGDFILFVGDLSRDKGIHILLEAYARLKDAPPLVLIGRRCPDTPSEFPSNVIFLNSWPHAAVMAAWRRCSIAVAPSVWPEPFGIVVLEAMAAGRPVIASRIGGLSDVVVDGETGLLVSPGDPVAVQQAFERLLADRALSRRLGQAGLRRVEKFRAGAVIPRIEQIYQMITSQEKSTELQKAIP